MRVPGRVHITWENDTTLRVDADAGTQTRLLHFDKVPPQGDPTWQGYSASEWQFSRPLGGSFGQPVGGQSRGGDLKVVTTRLRPGYLRKNGVPYSENATLTEYFDLVKEANGSMLLVATIVVTDPLYLREPFIISSHFRKQTSDAGWNPAECSANW